VHDCASGSRFIPAGFFHFWTLRVFDDRDQLIKNFTQGITARQSEIPDY
jgi:hypothetical protein